MKFRQFDLRDDVTQGEYVVFRTAIEELRPDAWENIENSPIELFYDVMIRAAITAGWIHDVVETNEYDEETSWRWNIEYLDDLPAGKAPIKEWGDVVFTRWLEYRTLDPN